MPQQADIAPPGPYTVVIKSVNFEDSEAQITEFRIPSGTGSHMWNTKDSLLEVHVGDTLRIYNVDSVNHQLHTSG